MNVKIAFSPNNKYDDVIKDLKKIVDEIDFEPNFLFLFLTKTTWRDYKKYLDFLKKRFSDVPMVGCIVEGYIVEDAIWTRGVAVLIGEFDGEVKVFYKSGNNAEKICRELGEEIGKDWDIVLVIFPLLYFSNKFEVLKAFIADRRYYWTYKRQKTIENKKRVLKEYSKYLESRFIFPANKVLRIFADKTGKNIPIIGMNLLPLEAESKTPLIIANFKDIGRGIAVVCFKGRVKNTNVVFYDVFPERGNSFKETCEIIRSYFSRVEDVEIIKSGVAVAEINDLKPTDYLKMKRSGFKEIRETEFIEKLEKGKLEMATPYVLGFISKDTYGATFSGLFDYPLNLFPLALEVDEFYDSGLFLGEVFRGGVREFAKVFDYRQLKGDFDFFILDQNLIMSYGGEMHTLVELIKEKSNFFFGILSSFPSAYLQKSTKKFLTEIHDRIHFSTTGTAVLFEFK